MRSDCDKSSPSNETMRHLKKDAPADVITILDAIERTADDCFRALHILRNPSNVAVRAVLAAAIMMIEDEQNARGSNTASFDALLISAGRFVPIALKWVHSHGWPPSEPARMRWTSELAGEAREVLRVARQYCSFETCCPMYHKNRYAVEVITPTHARFTVGGSQRDRQVSAYQKGIRPREGAFAARRPEKPQQTPQVQGLFESVFRTAKATSALSFEYTISPGLWRELLNEYNERVRVVSRRSLALSMGTYSLEDFNKVYAALCAVCAAHDHLCFLWGRAQRTYPVESVVLVRAKREWVRTLCALSGVNEAKSSAIIGDLTFDFQRSVDLHIQPFVPADGAEGTLAVAPPFPLSSRHDENVLRVCSQLRPDTFAATAVEKEKEMFAALAGAAANRHSLRGPISLPPPVPDIDLLIVDEDTSALAVVESKWIRKPVKTAEIPARDAEVLKGIDQLAKISGFLRDKPAYLALRKRSLKPVTEYEHVYHAVVAQDHWRWVEPADGVAIVEYGAFIQALARHDSIRDVFDELLRYDWLPVEGRDFFVKFESATANGVTIESEVFYAVP